MARRLVGLAATAAVAFLAARLAGKLPEPGPQVGLEGAGPFPARPLAPMPPRRPAPKAPTWAPSLSLEEASLPQLLAALDARAVAAPEAAARFAAAFREEPALRRLYDEHVRPSAAGERRGARSFVDALARREELRVLLSTFSREPGSLTLYEAFSEDRLIAEGLLKVYSAAAPRPSAAPVTRPRWAPASRY